MQIQFTKSIDALQADVFQALTDFEHAAENIRGITKIEMLTEGPVGVGTRFKETRVMFKKEVTETMEVTELDSPNHHTLESDSCGSHFRTVIRTVPRGSDATDVEVTFGAKPMTLFAKLMSPLCLFMSGSIRKCLEQDFDDVAANLRDQREAAPV